MNQEVEDLAISLTKAIKAAQIYGTSHPTFLNFYKPCFEKISTFLKENHKLSLSIERFTILYEEQIIYEETEKELSIAFRLFRDGIRQIDFIEEMSNDEFLIFLETISQSSKDLDIALSLWECDFTHIHFYVVEEEDESLSYKIPEMPFWDTDYEKKYDEIIKKEKIRMDERINLELSDEELKIIKREIVESERKPLLGLAINTLINILKIEKSPFIIDSLAELLELCINKHDFHNAQRIVHKLLNDAGMNIITRFEDETTIMNFSNFINIWSDRTFNEFIAFIGFYSKKTIPYLLKILNSIQKKERAEAMRHRLSYLCQEDPSPIIPFLKNADPKTVINAVAILGIMGVKSVVSHLEELKFHPDSGVRTAVINAFSQLNMPRMILSFTDDPDEQVRIKVLQALSHHRFPFIYETIIKRIRSKDFLKLDLNEQKEYFNCLVANGNERLVKDLDKMLNRWLLWGRKKYRIIRKLSAMALAHLSSESAFKVLQNGLKKRDADIKSACAQALKLE